MSVCKDIARKIALVTGYGQGDNCSLFGIWSGISVNRNNHF